MTTSDPIDLPTGWARTTLGEIGDWSSGGTPSRKESRYYGGDIPWVKTGNLNDGLVVEIDEQITQEGLKNSSAKMFPSESLVIAMYGATIGKLGILESAATTNQACAVLLAQGLTKDLIKFVFYYLLNSREDLREIGKGGAQPNISQTVIKKFSILLPPLNEQRRIVAKIEELTAHSKRARAALDEVPTLIEQFKQSVLAAAFRGDLTADWREKNPDVEPAEKLLERIRAERRKCWEESELEKMRARGKKPKNEKWKEKYTEPSRLNSSGLPQLPKNWCWVSWEQVAINQNGRAFPSKEYSESGIKLLRPGNLHISGRVEWTKSNSRWMPEEWGMKYPDYIIQENELVINLTAQSLADAFLGRVCLTGHDEKCLLNQRIARLKPSIISPKFCLWLLKSPIFRKYVDTLNTGSMIQHMFTSQIDKFIFPLPPLEEQAEIIEIVESQIKRMEDICLIAEQAIEDFTSIGQSILAKAFRGELVSQDPNDEPAAVLIERIRAEREKLKAAKKGKKRSQRKKAKAP